MWRVRRKVIAPTFSAKNLNHFVDIFVEQSNIMIKCLQPMAGAGTFSIWKYVASYTMDAVCETVLGVNMDAQKQLHHPCLVAMHEYLTNMSARLCQVWLQWDVIYKCLPMYEQDKKNIKIIHEFVNEIIRKKKAVLEKIGETGTDQPDTGIKTFLDLLISSSGGSNGYTERELREEALVLLLAGTDTSAAGTAFTVLMLSRNLEVQERAYEEVRHIFGNSKRHITVEDLSKLKYVEAVIKESLRLYPPGPIIVRKIDKDLNLPTGITLPAGSNAVINIWGTHRNPRYWGADAECFNPDRFMNGSLKHPAANLIFSYGSRNCVGYQYAMMSTKLVVASLLRNYRLLPPLDVSSEDLRKPLRLTYDIMLKHVDNFKMRLEHR